MEKFIRVTEPTVKGQNPRQTIIRKNAVAYIRLGDKVNNPSVIVFQSGAIRTITNSDRALVETFVNREDFIQGTEFGLDTILFINPLAIETIVVETIGEGKYKTTIFFNHQTGVIIDQNLEI